MIEIDRNERIGRMANIAFGRCLQMRGMFSNSRGAVMTATAAAEHLRVIDATDRRKHDDGMTVLADIGGLHVVGRLTDGVDGIVTTGTIAGDVVMIEVGRRERHRGVAVITSIAARDMAHILAWCRRAVVATHAGAEHLSVIDARHGGERDHGMAVFTNIGGLYVREGLTDRVDSIVTSHAVAGDIVVIEVGRCKGHGRVAVIAGIAAQDVARVLARRRYAIVATTTHTEHLRMVDAHDRREGHDAMAIFADNGRRDMRGGLADGVDGVVTTHTVARDVVVIEVGRRPCDRRMTVVAGIAAQNMAGRLTFDN